MSLDCFDGLLGLDRTCPPSGGGGVVALGSVGIDETLLAAFTGPEDSVASLIADAEAYARLVVQSDVLTYHAKSIIPHTFVDRQTVGSPDDTQTLVTGQTGSGGFLVTVDPRGASMVLRIVTATLHGAATGNVTVTITDLADGSTVGAFTIPAVAGQNVSEPVGIDIPVSGRKRTLFVHHPLASFYRTSMSGSCATCSSCICDVSGMQVTGARIAASVPMVRSNVRTSCLTSGLGLTVTLACDHGQLLCQYRDALALPYLEKVAKTLLRRGIAASTRVNAPTLDREGLEKRADRHGESYAKAMENVVGGMRTPPDPMCWVCRRNAVSNVVLP